MAHRKPHQWTEQETYNTVVRHLQVQGRQATTAEGYCVYRQEVSLNVGVLSCAVGCLIPAAKYNPDFENDTLVYRPLLQDLLVSEGYGECFNLLSALQSVHDTDENWNVSKSHPVNPQSGLPRILTKELLRVAADFKLEPLF